MEERANIVKLYDVSPKKEVSADASALESVGMDIKVSVIKQLLVVPEDLADPNSRSLVALANLNVNYFIYGIDTRLQVAARDLEISKIYYGTVRLFSALLHCVEIPFSTPSCLLAHPHLATPHRSHPRALQCLP